jgi:uncharacterized protein YdeI (YjbR/CyaY-like superfamily)
MAKADGATYFDSPAAFRRWLAANHAKAAELLVGFWKQGTGRPTLTWSESVDEALSFGWIDGVRRGVDAERYTIRFTPRRPGSSWSAINVAKIAKLEAEGRLRPEGRRAFEARSAQRTGIYSYERRDEARLAPARARAFKANAKAWAWFEGQAPSYRKVAIYWVETAKQEATRDRRLATLVADSAAGRRVPPLRPRPGPGKRPGGRKEKAR